MSGHDAWENFEVAVPGTSVSAFLGRFVPDPDRWVYSLWAPAEDGCLSDIVATGDLNLKGLSVTPDQVARVAFLLSVEYAS